MSQILHSVTFLEQFFQPDMHHLWMPIPVIIISVPIVTLTVFLGRKSAEVKLLRGLIPVFAWCGKKIRSEKGNWVNYIIIMSVTSLEAICEALYSF